MLKRLRRRWKRLLVLLILLPLIGFGCANNLILHPSRHYIDPHGAMAKKIPFRDGELEVWTARSPACGNGEAKASLLEFTGNGTRAEEIATWLVNDRWKQWPVEIWVLNYPGYGGS